jgi:hypothetical protein
MFNPRQTPPILPERTQCRVCKGVPPLGELCSNCREYLLESLAAMIDPTYDPKAMNDWERCHGVLARLYGQLEE